MNRSLTRPAIFCEAWIRSISGTGAWRKQRPSVFAHLSPSDCQKPLTGRSRSSDPSRSIEVHMGSAIAAFFFNNWDRLPPSSCYLLAPGIARIEPFLPVLERLVIEGPGGFVAGLVLDLVEVSPKPEHLSFIATAAEVWLTEHPDNTIFWVDNEVARRLCVLVERIGTREPYSDWDPLLRDRVGHILSALVGLGVPLAGQLEQDIAGSGDERR